MPYSLLVKYQRTEGTFYSSILRKVAGAFRTLVSAYLTIQPSIHSSTYPSIHPSVCRLATFGLSVCLPNNTVLHPSGHCNLYFSISSTCRKTRTQLWDYHVISARLCYLRLHLNFPSSCGRRDKSPTIVVAGISPRL